MSNNNDEYLALDIQRRQEGLNELLDLAAKRNLRVEVSVDSYGTLSTKFSRKQIAISVFKPLSTSSGA